MRAVALAGITMSAIPSIDYQLLYQELVVRSNDYDALADVELAGK